MARTTYGAISKLARRRLEKAINERALLLGEKASKVIAEDFAKTAKGILEKYSDTNAKDSASKSAIQSVSNSITVKKKEGGYKVSNSRQKTGYTVEVPFGSRNKLAMYLEYGTGLEGDGDEHPEAESLGWRYATKDKTKKTIDSPLTRVGSRTIDWYPTLNINGVEKKGFVFKYKGQYLDKEDILFRNKRVEKVPAVKIKMIEEYPSHSKYGKPFIVPAHPRRVRYKEKVEVESKQEYAISSGIKPARYIYTSKMKIKNALDSLAKERNIPADQFIQKLQDELRRK